MIESTAVLARFVARTSFVLDSGMDVCKIEVSDAAPVVKIGLYRIEAVWSRVPSTDHLPIHPQSSTDFA